MNKLETLKTWVQESNRIVFFGGAGVSTESGIPDFRSVDGLYHQKFDYPPEVIISHSFYERNPEYFFRFYREKMLPLGFEPNITHRILAKWEQEGKLLAVVTQNIDGLHQKAGSKKVYELHGSVLRNYCTRCGKFYSPLALPLGELSPKVTERALQSRIPSPSSRCSATSPTGRGKWCRSIIPLCLLTV